MKNKIIYGNSRLGKTKNYFIPMIENWKNKVIAISLKSNEKFEELERLKGFKIIHLENPHISFEKIFSHNKILLILDSNSNPFEYNNELKNIITYILANANNFEKPLLLAIDEFFQFDLSKKYDNGQSLFLNLLTSNSIDTVFILQHLKTINQIYTKEYKNIISLCETIWFM